MDNKRVLIIEDEKDDYLKIKDSIIPSGMLPLFDGNECLQKAVEVFASTESGALNRSCLFIAETIEKHYNEIRLIVCDLRINGDNNAGKSIISMLRNGRITQLKRYCEEIPIVIVSSLEDKEKLKAFETTDGNSFFLSKSLAFSSDGAYLLRSIINKLAEQFDRRVKKIDLEKKYKIALSFTANNKDADGKELKIRSFIHEVAKGLYEEYTKDRVFFDMDHQEESNAKDKAYFAKNYNNAEFVVVFLSEGYKNKTSRWSTAEWDVIKELDLKNKVIFVAIDSTLKESDFKNCLGIEEVIYKNMLAGCSRFNELKNVEDSESINFIKDKLNDLTIPQIAAELIAAYSNKTTEIVGNAVEFIIRTIKIREQRMLNES